MSISWVFDPIPPSGKRTGGDAAEYSFRGQIDTLVRETLQNSMDAALSQNDGVEVAFRVVDLRDQHLDDFLSSMEWATLADNLKAVPTTRGGLGISQALEKIETQNQLRLLVIEDRGTRGLEGEEQRTSAKEQNNFCALVRDELYSDKATDEAGGSFGLGKSVLWAYSSIKTVLFASIPFGPPAGRSGVRFVGRSMLPFHETEEDGPCTGDGWLGAGRRIEDPRERRAESVWGGEAARAASSCYCPRDPGDTGLSVVIVGFSEPGEEDRDSSTVVDSVVEAAARSFWPAITRGRLTVLAEEQLNEEVIRTVEVEPAAQPGLKPLVELLERFDNRHLEERDGLDQGESAVAWVDVEVPERLVGDPHPALTGRVPVLVHLVRSGEEDPSSKDMVFRFRGPGMVVRSESRRNLSIAARPYVACVAAGLACDGTSDSVMVERFLRAAEPPAHDEWTHNTRQIKQAYRAHGCRAKLQRFEEAIRDAITKLVSQPEERGGPLPRSIVRHLRFGRKGGGGNPRFVSITRQQATVTDGTWHFRAHCRRIRPDEHPWWVKVRFKYGIDGGGGDDVHAISHVEAVGATEAVIRKGVGFLQFPPEVTKAGVRGSTDAAKLPAVGVRAAVVLRIDAARGEMPDA